MKLTFWEWARYLVLVVLVVLITISSHPTIMAMTYAAGIEKGTILSRYIILVFGALFVMCLNPKSMLKPKMIRVSWFLWIFIVLYYLFTFALFGKKAMMGDVRYIAICLVAIMIGWQMDLDEKRFKIILLAFSGVILYVGLMQVFTNVGGFVILDQYHTDNKNSLGVMLSTGAIIFLFMALNSQGKPIVKVIFYVLAVLTFVVLLTIRARAASVTTILMLLYVLYEHFKGKNFILYLGVGLVLLVIVYLVLPSASKEFVYNSFFQNYEGSDVTGGRAERNRAALEVLAYSPLLGNLKQNVTVGWVHNYPLNKMFEYGLVFAFPILLLYLYLLFHSAVKTIRSDNHNTCNIGYYLLIIPFIISMVEPTFPFGPGTATVFNFIMFGMALKYAENEKEAALDLEVDNVQESDRIEKEYAL
jgi:hypothetical protein